jgi:ATP-binding cassette subfamily B protein
MLRKDVYLTLLVIAPLPILALIIYTANTIINRKSERVQALLSELTTHAQESYSGIRVIKSFVQEKAMLGFFRKASDDYRNNAVSLAKTEAVYFPSMTLMIGLSTLITIMVGGQMVLANPAQASLIVEFVIYINMLTFPVSAIGWTASMIQRAAASQQRINEFLHTVPGIVPAADPVTEKVTGRIQFQQVSFTYEHTGIKALDKVNLSIEPGEKVLVIGRTGSGKSTLLQLLLRNFEPQQGIITIGGIPLNRYGLKALREQISFVPQDVFLFSDTVAGNIRFGAAEAPLPALKAVAEKAAVAKEIEGLDKGYDTVVGERGVTLSGGQKQRISIARALIKQPEIMLFDDCLSAVDAQTEQTIIGHLYTALASKTVVIVSHRIFSGFVFDKIVVMDNGRIAEMGRHEELLEMNGYYAKVWRTGTREAS